MAKIMKYYVTTLTLDLRSNSFLAMLQMKHFPFMSSSMCHCIESIHTRAYRMELQYNCSFVTLLSLNSANVSTMMPNTMLRPMIVTIMKKVISKKIDLKAASLKFVGKVAVCIHTSVVSLSLQSTSPN